MKKSRFTDSLIMAILKQAEAGTPVAELCREHGMSNGSFYKWRSRFRRDGSLHDGPSERAGRRKSPPQKDVCRRTTKSREHSGGYGKKVVKPSPRKQMACDVGQESKRQHTFCLPVVCCQQKLLSLSASVE
ncbi:transposase [Serratia liquefaciens]|uniref:transposase n=1 Tax=Serratia liquefaciens TaxID=614 RepID=UPI0021B70B8F|nr:transposase [Serratia liquefaciens]